MRLPKLKVEDPIIVEWRDAADLGDESWTDLKDALKDTKDMPVSTIGYYLGETEHNLWLFSNVEHRDKANKSITGRMQIPLGCIKKITKLRK